MSSTIESPSEAEHIDALLDQLMPRPGPAWRRFATGTALTVVVVTVGLAWMFGHLVPRPTANGSYSGGGDLIHESQRNVIAVSIYLPNWSKRDVRIMTVSLNAPGVRLVEAGARPKRPESDSGTGNGEKCEDLADGSELCTWATIPVSDGYFDPWPVTVSTLPVTIAAGGSVDLFLAFEPTACNGPLEFPWGQVEVTLDFGLQAVPPWSNTIRLENPLVAHPSQAQLSAADRTIVYSTLDESTGGLLAAMCELTGLP